MTTETGHLIDIVEKTAGDDLAVAALAAATTLVVLDVADFDETGGHLLINGEVLAYAGCDDDTNSITLIDPLTDPAAIGDRVDIWDPDNSHTVVVPWARVRVDGMDTGDPIEAEVDHAHLPLLSRLIRSTAGGESVTLERTGSRWTLTRVAGKSLSLDAMMLVKGGLTTREEITDPGVELTSDGITAYKAGGDPTVRIDSATGDATFIGEIGTNFPGEIGIFAFSNIFSWAGEEVTRPTLQFNVGASRLQPSIQADTAATSGLWLSSGANTLESESWLYLNNGAVQLGIEDSAGSGVAGTQVNLTQTSVDMLTEFGARVYADNNEIQHISGYVLGPGGNLAAVVLNVDDFFQAGFRTAGGGTTYGLQVDGSSLLRLCAPGSGLEVVNGAGTSWRDVECRDVNYHGALVSVSDSRLKQDIEPIGLDALDLVTNTPVYEWAYIDNPTERRLGVMADDLPAILTRPANYVESNPIRHLSLSEQNAVLWRAIQQLAAQLNGGQDT